MILNRDQLHFLISMKFYVNSFPNMNRKYFWAKSAILKLFSRPIEQSANSAVDQLT